MLTEQRAINLFVALKIMKLELLDNFKLKLI